MMSATCPDDVDVMVLQDGSDTDLNVVSALAASRLKPKAAMGLSYQNNIVLAAASGLPVEAAVPLAGWLLAYPVDFPTEITLTDKGGKLGDSYDAGYAHYVWNLGANVSVSTPNIAYVYWACIDIVQTAITQAVSLNASDLRAAMFSLNGEIGMLGLLNFSSATGINDAKLSVLRQMSASGAVSNLQLGSFELIYPYPWPWPSNIRPGGKLDVSQSNALALIAVVICVLGAWVGQIITEQSVFVRRKGGWWQAWLFVVALALGGVSVWCSQLFLVTALTLSKPGGSSLPLSFSGDVVMLAGLPSILLTWCGLLVMMCDFEDNAVTDLKPSSDVRRQMKQQKEEKKKLAALSSSAHLQHLIHAVSWRAAVGGLMMAAAVVLTRVTLWYVWIQDASWDSAGWAWTVTSLLDVTLIPLALLMFFHALRSRIAAVFLFAAVVMADWQVQLAGLTFHYEPGLQLLSTSLRNANLSMSTLDLIVGILAAFICLVFIGLQFSRMRLSRNGLTVLAASLESVISTQKGALAANAVLIAQLRQQLDHMARMAELININSPLPTEYAFAMAACTSYSTFADQLSSSEAQSTITLTASESASGARQQTPDTAETVTSRASQSGTIWAARLGHTLRMSRKSAEDTSSQEQTRATSNEWQATDATQVIDLAGSPGAVPVGQATSHRASINGEALVTAARSSSASVTSRIPVVERSKVQQGSLNKVASASHFSLPNTLGPWRTSSVGVSGRTSVASTKCWKSFEEGLTTCLEQQEASRKRAHTNNLSKTSAGEADTEASSFDVTSPLLGNQAVPNDSAAQQLSVLLAHPVCLEVLKAALQEVHSVENLVFYLHVQRYKRMQSTRLRKLLASCIHDHFIRANAPQQINLSTKMRDAITAAISRKSDEACTAELFKEAEKEVMTLMNSNVLHTLPSCRVRLCAWILAATPLSALTESGVAVDDAQLSLPGSLLAEVSRLPVVRSSLSGSSDR